MLGPQDLAGCIPALITPLREQRDGRLTVDYEQLIGLVRQHVTAGVSGLLFVGTTGQSATLTRDEKITVVTVGANAARECARQQGRTIRVLAAAGGNATQAAIDLSLAILDATDVDALLHVTGYYNNPPQEGLRRHFEVVADATMQRDVPIVLYNVPGRTASDLAAETTIALAQHPGILGIKEASGNLDKVQQILDATDRASFAMISGEDHLVAEIIRRGGVGVISASASYWPKPFQRLAELALAGEEQKAAELQEALMPCIRAVFSAKSPIPLARLHGTRVRLPLVDVEALKSQDRAKVEQAIAAALAIDHFPHVDQN